MMKFLERLDKLQGKQPYQRFTVKHGIETFEVLIPLKSASVFEQDFNQLADKSKSRIVELVQQHCGKVRD